MNDEANKRIAKNSMVLYLRLILTIVIGLWSSRILLKNLGFNDYGLYNVVGGVITMFGFINASLTSSATRFITFNINNKEELRSVFGTVKVIHLLFALIIIVIGETLGLWFVFNKLEFPEGRELAVHCVYQFSIAMAILNIINTPYNALLVAHENMSIYAFTTLGSVILRFIATILIAYVFFDRLIFYAFACMIILLCERLFVNLYSRYKYPESRAKAKFAKQNGKKILKFSFWSVIGDFSVVCYTQGLNILLNIFYGSIANAARGIAVQIQSIVTQFCTNFQMAVKPQIIKSFAENDIHRMHQLIILSSKFTFYLLSIIIIPIVYNSDVILKLWLQEVPKYTQSFVCIILLITLLSSLSNPLITAIHATGNIKKFQVCEGLCLLTILPISYITLKFFEVPPISVFIINLFIAIITQVIRAQIVLPSIQMRFNTYLRQIIAPAVLTFAACNIFAYVFGLYLPHSLLYTGINILLTLIICCVIIITIGCNKAERIFILNKIHNVYNKTIIWITRSHLSR